MSQTPKELVKQLKEELRKLEEEQKVIESKISGLNTALEAYTAKKPSEMREAATSFDFRLESKQIFESEGNKPLPVKDLVAQILKKHPELTKRQIKSKIAYAVRPNAKVLLKAEYGKYTHADLPVAPLT